MALILNIETSTQVCSVALSRDLHVVACRESDTDKAHASLLSSFIHEILQEGAVKQTDIEAVSVSQGPGSYTGLRIGVSTAKGIAYGLNIPLIAVSTLQAMAYGISNHPAFRDLQLSDNGPEVWLCPMIDARRMEVYYSFFNTAFEPRREIEAAVIKPGSFDDILSERKVAFFGNGADKCKTVLTHPNAIFLDGIFPSARCMIPFSDDKFRHSEFEDAAYFEPYYLKDFIPTIPKKNIFR